METPSDLVPLMRKTRKKAVDILSNHIKANTQPRTRPKENHEGARNNTVERRKEETKKTKSMKSYSVISDQPVVKCLVVPRVYMLATIDSYTHS